MRFILHRFYLLIIIQIKEMGNLKLLFVVYRLSDEAKLENICLCLLKQVRVFLVGLKNIFLLLRNKFTFGNLTINFSLHVLTGKQFHQQQCVSSNPRRPLSSNKILCFSHVSKIEPCQWIFFNSIISWVTVKTIKSRREIS